MCDKATDACPSLKFAPDQFFTNKMFEDLDDTIFYNDDIVFVNADSDIATFFSNDMGLVSVDLNNDDNDDDDDPETIIHVRPMASCNRFKQLKACYKDISKELIPLPPTRW